MEDLDTKALLDAAGQKENLCPFGCADDTLDEQGYCPHLVGFTNDGKSYEPVVPEILDGERTGRVRVVGGKKGKERKSVPQGARLVNPERMQLVNGLRQLAKRWVSSRVYVKDEKKAG